MSEKRDPYGTGEDFQRVKADCKEGFVRTEYGDKLAQQCEKQEVMSSVDKIEKQTLNIVNSLRNLEGLTRKINDVLLPIEEKKEVKGESDKSPNGWLEVHLYDLDNAMDTVTKITNEIGKLYRAIVIDNKNK